MGAWTHVIVREHGAKRIVLAVHGVEDRICPPALGRALGAAKWVFFSQQLFIVVAAESALRRALSTLQQSAIAGRIGLRCGKDIAARQEQWMGLWYKALCGGACCIQMPVIGENPVADFLRRKRSIFIIEAIGGAVGGRHIEFDQMDMLTDRVGWRVDLEIIDI